MPKRDNLSRRKPTREQFPVYLIVCEGSITEKQYFSDLRHHERIALDLEFMTGGVPKTLVEQAVAAKKSKRGYDQIWVVFDVDEHPKLAEAQQQARSNQLSVAQSNPCFELWALLHFQDQTASLTRHHAQRLCKQYIPGYEKLLPYAQLTGRLEDACVRRPPPRTTQSKRNPARQSINRRRFSGPRYAEGTPTP